MRTRAEVLLKLRGRAWLLSLLLLLILPIAEGQPSFVQPETSIHVTDDGTVALAWSEHPASATTPVVYEVRRWLAGAGEEGVLVYEGPDTATFLSGLPEGEYRFRLRARTEDGAYPNWEDEYLTVTVKYIGRALVILLMSVGFITFLAIVGSILIGHRRALREEAAGA